jgi:hypothetical protein
MSVQVYKCNDILASVILISYKYFSLLALKGHIAINFIYNDKKSLKIPNSYSGAVNRRINNTMAVCAKNH